MSENIENSALTRADVEQLIQEAGSSANLDLSGENLVNFDTYLQALFTATLLNSNKVKQMLSAITFTDAKRPYTKDILMRIDLGRIAQQTTFQEISEFWLDQNYKTETEISENDFDNYRAWLLDTDRNLDPNYNGYKQLVLSLDS